MRTYLKTFGRMFQKHVTRFLSLILMVLISVGFIAGVGSAADRIYISMSDYYESQNVSDFIAKSTADTGFTDTQVQTVKEMGVFSAVETGASVDIYLTEEDAENETPTRLYFLDSLNSGLSAENITVNTPVVKTVFDNTADAVNPVACEIGDNKIESFDEPETITLDFVDILDQLTVQGGGDALTDTVKSLMSRYISPVTVTVTQVWSSPLTFAMDGEPSYLNGEDVETPDTVNAVNALINLKNVLYIPSDLIPEVNASMLGLNGPLLGTMDMQISLADRKTFNAFSNAYDKEITRETAALSETLGSDMELLTLYENYSFLALKSYADDVLYIGYLLMVIFLLVTVLVVLSTMSRMVEEERSQIACMKTLGYSSGSIIMKYILFALIAMIVGAVVGYFVGMGVSSLFYYVFNYTFLMPPMTPKTGITFFIITVAVILVAMMAGTVWAGVKETREKPAELLRAKPPKAGKKVFLERIPFIWNRLSFKYKSTFRNVLRYLPRFIMTVVSVAIATALVNVGLALMDLCLFGGISSASVTAIGVVVVIFAALLAILVVYTLTNINISEREKELATLKVLGYQDNEVCSYIYREVYIDAIIGIIIGLPLSLPIDLILFAILGMGTILGVTWFWWIVGVALILLFTFLVTMMLSRKMVKIDMNESLKAVE
ncbi:MAG: ABC transporter permease [Clostridia bacterium]|nr:ABC transporter permease [Clostridia bacterium]